MAAFDHPYVPRDLKLEDYVPCLLSQSEIVKPYIASSLVVVALIWLFSGHLAASDDHLLLFLIITRLSNLELILAVRDDSLSVYGSILVDFVCYFFL